MAKNCMAFFNFIELKKIVKKYIRKDSILEYRRDSF